MRYIHFMRNMVAFFTLMNLYRWHQLLSFSNNLAFIPFHTFPSDPTRPNLAAFELFETLKGRVKWGPIGSLVAAGSGHVVGAMWCWFWPCGLGTQGKPEFRRILLTCIGEKENISMHWNWTSTISLEKHLLFSVVNLVESCRWVNRAHPAKWNPGLGG